jgi:hypothetical protein
MFGLRLALRLAAGDGHRGSLRAGHYAPKLSLAADILVLVRRHGQRPGM